MKIYTSYYGGEQIGTSICISITQKHGCSFQDLPLFKPSDTLFKFWKNSKKDAEAEKHYTDVFMANLASEFNDKAVDIWLRKVAKSGSDVTLNCHEIKGFCHRHLVGRIIKSKRPELWGGEISKIRQQPDQLTLFPSTQATQTNLPNKQTELSRQENQAVQIAIQRPTPIASRKLEIHEMGYTKPRYTWADQGALAKWWNPHGEEISFISNLETGENKYNIHKAEDIPDGWGAILAYGGIPIPKNDLILVFDPHKEARKAG